MGDLFGLGTDKNTSTAKDSARPSSDTGTLFGLEPSAPKTTPGNQGSGNTSDVLGEALAEHDRRVLEEAARKLGNANSRVGQHCDCVLAHADCPSPWSSGSWKESASFLREVDNFQESRGQLCDQWQQLKDGAPRDTVEEINTATAKVQTIAQRLDSKLDEISRAASADRRRYEREEEDREIEEERRLARARESQSPVPQTNLYMELQQIGQSMLNTMDENNREIQRIQREHAERQRRERAEQEERYRQEQQRRYQQQANAAAAQSRENERLNRERQRQLEVERQRKMEEERRDAQRRAELERQRQQEAERQAKLERQRQLEAERQAKMAAEEQASRDYLSAVARGTKAKAIQCPGAIHAIVKPANIKPAVVSCIDVHWTAYCPGDRRGIDGVTDNATGFIAGCYGDSHEISPKPQCAAEQIRVEIREVRACGK